MEDNEFYKVRIKNRTCYYFDDIIKLEDFDLDNTLIDEKSHENIVIYDISHKTSKELRSFILWIFCVGLLFCSLRIYITLYFPSILFSVLCIFCLICLELEVIL